MLRRGSLIIHSLRTLPTLRFSRQTVGVDRVIALDLRRELQGFFSPRVPVDNVGAASIGAAYFANKDLVDPVVISPHAGGVYRAKQFRELLNHALPEHNAALGMIIKQRERAGQIERMDLVGSVDGSDVIVLDDMIDTSGTIAAAASRLKANGARRVFAFASHGLLSGDAASRITHSELDEVVITNTIPRSTAATNAPKIVQLSVAPLLAEAIVRVHRKQSVSALDEEGFK